MTTNTFDIFSELSSLQLNSNKKLHKKDIAKLVMVAEKNPICIVFTDNKGTIEYVNEAFVKNTGYSRKELIGNNPRILSTGYHPKSFYKELWKSVLTNKIWRGTFRNKRKNGEIYWEKAVLAPLVDENGKLVNVIGMKEDITEQVIAEKELQEYKDNLENLVEQRTKELIIAKEKAEEANKLKTAFLANIQHEIRTPLNGIQGFSSLLEENLDQPEKSKLYIQTIQDCSTQLLNIVENILNTALIESNPTNIIKTSIPLCEFLDEIHHSYKKTTEDKKIDFTINCKTDASEMLHTDLKKFKKSILNILNNAFKFTFKGSIELGVDKKNKKLLFYIKDTGIGISKEYQQTVFDPFIKAGNSKNKLFGGTGIGLTLSKAYIELLGGEIWLESEPELGTTVFFTIG